MDQQQQQQYPPQSSGYGYSGGVDPRHYPLHMTAAGGGFGARAMAAPMTNYNTQGYAGATTIPNFGGGGAMGGSPGASAEMGDTTAFVPHPPRGVAPPPPGAANYYGGHPTALPPLPFGAFPAGGAPIPNNAGNETGRSSQSRNSKARDDDDEDPSIFGLLMTGISRQIKSCVTNSCGGAESDDEDEEKTMGNPSMISESGTNGANTNAGRVLVQNQADAFGNVYSGQMLGGKRDGIGTIHYAKSGDRYEGMWQGHLPHGDGKVIRGDGTGMFEGRWHHGTLQMVKNGKYVRAKNDAQCAFSFQRKRILKYLILSFYFFLFVSIPGHACVQDAEGKRYEGNFSNWQKHGKGRVQTVTGEQYEGEWVNGVRQGFGILIRPDGSRFEGMFDKSESNHFPFYCEEMCCPLPMVAHSNYFLIFSYL